MVFSTIIFLCAFLPFTIIGYYIMPNCAKNIWLLACSIFFYGWGEPGFVWIMLGSILCNYIFGLLLEADLSSVWRKLILMIAVLTNLGLLFMFKYFTFVAETVKELVGGNFSVVQIALPIGISFYTFQGLSYVVDVYRAAAESDEKGQKVRVAQRSLVRLALYIAMFPQLIAGPIVRYHDIQPYLTKREHSLAKFSSGAERFVIGLAKKAILANVIGEMANNIMQSDVTMLKASVAWLGAIGYTLQIYFDFSGYSDMAIGLGRMFGFEFMENFNYPYISRSIKEFWRRWHISLSGWFRDYLYIPLGGSRKGNVYINLFLVFLATGIWHGAAWGFVFWGIYHGFFRLVEYYFEQRKKKADLNKGQNAGSDDEAGIKRKPVRIVRQLVCWLYTMLVVVVGWVIFAKVDLRDGLDYLAVMFGISHNTFVAYDAAFYMDRQTTFFMVLSIIACIPISRVILFIRQSRLGTFCHINEPMSQTMSYVVCFGKRLLLLGLLVLCFVFIINSSYNPFIYFRF